MCATEVKKQKKKSAKEKNSKRSEILFGWWRRIRVVFCPRKENEREKEKKKEEEQEEVQMVEKSSVFAMASEIRGGGPGVPQACCAWKAMKATPRGSIDVDVHPNTHSCIEWGQDIERGGSPKADAAKFLAARLISSALPASSGTALRLAKPLTYPPLASLNLLLFFFSLLVVIRHDE